MKVIKRDGSTEMYSSEKISRAIYCAFVETGEGTYDTADRLAEIVASNMYALGNEHHIEDIQDAIELILMVHGFTATAKAFILYRQKRTEKRQVGWQLDELQSSIFDKKYNLLEQTVDEWLDRVSGGNLAVRKLIRDKKFLFGGRILAHRGVDGKITLSNCYVMPEIDDDIESIFDTAKNLARTYSYGGGCGIHLGRLRPKGSVVNNSAKETSGSVSFMPVMDVTTATIGQLGRRGALMISHDIGHPDILDFIRVKTVDGSITKANISIRFTDKFFDAVLDDSMWVMQFIVEDTDEKITAEINARDLYREICEVNWDWAEVGFLFWDRIENYHLMSAHPEHKYAGVNPCAEEPLMADGSCLLGSINVSAFVKQPFTDNAYFDTSKFKEAVKTSVVGLNDVLDEGIPKHPLQAQRENARDWRQIGLGIMGIADMLIKLGIRYGSAQSLSLLDELGKEWINSALQASAVLARDYGSFPKYNWEAVNNSLFFHTVATPETIAMVKAYGLRNSQLLTIAPTGSISTMWGISGGIEPLIYISYTRKTESLFNTEVSFDVFSPVIKELMTAKGIKDVKDLPDYVVTAHDLDYKSRIKVQAVLQKYIDASISSTVNLPKETTVEDVENMYLYAWNMGLKGLTMFRDGCKRTGILTAGAEEEPDKAIKTAIPMDKTVDKFVTCAECGEPIEMISGGCSICMNCGYSPCAN